MKTLVSSAFWIASAIVITFAAVASCSAPNDEGTTAAAQQTTIMVNADIVTMNPRAPSAVAMAYTGKRIVAIGTEAEVRKAVGASATVRDLGGRTIVPGFFESHDHMFMSSATSLLTDVAPFTTPTLAQALEKIRLTGGRGHHFVVDGDIKGFFDAIDQEILMKLVERRISDRRV